MAKKLTFDKLPEAVQMILDILSSEDSEHTALPELIRRVALLEKKIDYLQRTLSPDRPVMDMPEVCRALKLRPKAVSELAMSGVLPSREQGKKTVFYEDGVVRYFMSGAAWKEAAASKPVSAREVHTREVPPESDSAETVSQAAAPENRRRIDINDASDILGRSTAAVYQLIQAKTVPYYKDGRKVYFFSDELREWAKHNPPRRRKSK
jgi:predicted DNA-binding transcriptional regulator AlpA